MTVEFWTAVGSIGAILALAWAIWTQWRERHRRNKRLIVEQTSWSPVTNDAMRIDGKPLRVSFGDQPVRNFAISRIRVANTGGAPILSSDFEGEIVLRYIATDEIYFTTLKGRTSQSINPELDVQETSISIKPLLLNPGDSFVLEVGVDLKFSGSAPDIEAYGRIAGVADIEVPAAPPRDPAGISEIKLTAPMGSNSLEAAPDSTQLYGAVGLGLIGGVALAGVLATYVYNAPAESLIGIGEIANETLTSKYYVLPDVNYGVSPDANDPWLRYRTPFPGTYLSIPE